ncbi:MAG: hypothetical protein HGA69_00410 [Desulfobulbaceae bacterium]|nr:hypothetical protein [Desulfobulbaceae bacterium]
MDKKNLDDLQDFLDFVQQDFDKVDERKRESLIVKGIEYEFVAFSFLQFVDKSPLITKESWESLVSAKKDVLNVLRHIIKITQDGGFFVYDKTTIFSQSMAGDGVFIQCTENSVSLQSFHEITVIMPGQAESFKLKTSFNPYILFDRLEGVSHSRLKVCPECETIFVQKTAREKKYCSDFCKNKHHLKLKKA